MPVPAPPPLRASLVIDYQNVHLTGHELYDSTRHLPKHETIVQPLLFAQAMLKERNARQRPPDRGGRAAVLSRVLVYRGLPSADHDQVGNAMNLAQASEWTKDLRVHVTLRPLKYYYERDAAGNIRKEINGVGIYSRVAEKGVDVLCALAVLREAIRDDIDVVVLCSSDSDLAPAIEEGRLLNTAKIETFSWWNGAAKGKRGHWIKVAPPVWNTRLDEATYNQVIDRTTYSPL